jgi:uncharacterized membrane protein
MKILGWAVFIFFAIFVGLYPFSYLVFDMSQGFLSSKTQELLQSFAWQTGFFAHILLGAVALLTGWSQFSTWIRNKNLRLHRTLGKIYLISVSISGVAGLYIAFYATGGYITMVGFSGLAIAWLFTTLIAYRKILDKNIDQHRYWMLRSYALCFAAVTLRIWLPLLQFAVGMEFILAYRIISWLCWVPNLIIAEAMVFRLRTRGAKVIKMVAENR